MLSKLGVGGSVLQSKCIKEEEKIMAQRHGVSKVLALIEICHREYIESPIDTGY